MSARRTSRFGITGYDPTGSDLLNTIATIGNNFLDQIDADTTGWSSGVIASRPAAGTAGRIYLATDDRTSSPNGTLYFDNGTAWVIVPTNNYAAGPIGSRPRTGTRGQFYYATDDTTSASTGTLYVFDGGAWNIVVTGTSPFSTYKDLYRMSGTNISAATELLNTTNLASAVPVGATTYLIYLDPADYAAGARTVKMRLRAILLTDATAPGISYTYGLYPVASWGGASGATPTIASLGTVVSGSAVTFSSPGTSAQLQSVSADFAMPAAGFYAIGVAPSGTAAANALTSHIAHLQMRQV